MGEADAAWKQRENDLLGYLDSEIKRYTKFARRSRIAGRTISIIALICSVLAPVTVVSGAQGGGLSLAALSISQNTLTAASVVLTILLGLVDGLRRTFRFEQSWAGAMTALIAIERAREGYLDNQVGKTVGSEPWVANLVNLRKSTESVAQAETKQFFEVVLNEDKSGVRTNVS